VRPGHLGPLQSQQLLSVRLRILFRETAERQWPVRIRAAVLAMEFLASSMHDFFGGGGGISSVPWFLGSLCQASFAFLNFSEIRSLRYAIEAVGTRWLLCPRACPLLRSQGLPNVL